MNFEINGKVAIITGGASTLGFEYAKELLRDGLKAVVLVDSNDKAGEDVLKAVTNEFGANRAIYFNANTSNKYEFEEIFKKTIAAFGNIDILINNAGMLNDEMLEEETHLISAKNGINLGITNYISKHKSGNDGLIVNNYFVELPYMNQCCTKTQNVLINASEQFGDLEHHKRTHVKVITFFIVTYYETSLEQPYKIPREKSSDQPNQERKDAVIGLVKVVKQAALDSVWIVEKGEEPFEIDFPEE